MSEMTTKKLFDEAETVLLKNYATAEQLRATLDGIPAKYALLWDRIIAEVCDGHPELTIKQNRSIASTGAVSRRGVIVLSSNKWPADGDNWPTGFWAESIGLDVIAGGAEGNPFVSIAFTRRDQRSGKKIDALALMHLLYEQARTLLDTVEFAALSKVDDATLFGIDLSANQLHAALLNDDSGTEFVRLVSTKFQVLTKLIGPLNTLFP